MSYNEDRSSTVNPYKGVLQTGGIVTNMLVAIAMVHLPFGFFMNWFGTKQGEGFEFHLLAIGLGLAVLIGGSGALSIDHALARRKLPPEEQRVQVAA